MNPYSLDLRQKIVEAYENAEGSQRQLAKRFHVSLAFVQRLLNRYHNEGTIEPRARVNGFPPKLAAYESEVREIVAENADDTLAELSKKLTQRLGFEFSPSTLHYYLERLKLTRKKNASRRPSRNRKSTKLESRILASSREGEAGEPCIYR
jgi:transposase